MVEGPMYVDLITAALAAQSGLAAAYEGSARRHEVGLYVLTVNRVTLTFFESIQPPDAMAVLHTTFLDWQRLGASILLAELREEAPAEPETVARFGLAGQAFAQLFTTVVRGQAPDAGALPAPVQ